ncbi:hypothetical protein MTR67_001247 [Solanum verrucosum]|uniref:Uncharacterized protein n=1 Tax=Solanum verrucosum TaxID=315347 RepID=A0AAF0PNZ2_SOLVR|nr:hypothetical protein MTR67_001247 [Solanum verrucosum]
MFNWATNVPEKVTMMLHFLMMEPNTVMLLWLQVVFVASTPDLIPVEEDALLGIVDSHWGGNIDDMKSTTGYAFSLDLNEDSPTDSAELKIENRSKRDLDTENLNLHHEKM